MANTQTLASFQKPTINGLAAGMIFASTAMENIYQGEIEKGGRGVTQKFSSDTSGAQIRVIRPLPLPIDARELGAAINGGNFSAYTLQPQSHEYGLNIITVIDDQVDIPDVRMDMIPVDIAKMYIQNIADKVTVNINAIKIAARVYTCFSAEEELEGSANIVKYNPEKDDILTKAVQTNAKLNKGDAKNGVSTFPMRDRIALIQSEQYSTLLTTKGVFAIGGSNYGYDILRKGGVDAETKTPELLDDGYLGTIAGVPYHFVSDYVIETVCKYLGFPSGTLDSVHGHVASAHGNLFGLATGNSINTIPSPLGQGVRLQPKYRMGAACILPKSVSWLVDSTKWVNPYGLKKIFEAGVEWSYKAPGSRQTLKATLTAGGSATAFTPRVQKGTKLPDGTLTYVDLTDGVYGAWVNEECYSIEEFLAAYNDASNKKGKVTNFGAQNTFTGVATGETVTLLVLDAQGTVADLVHATAA